MRRAICTALIALSILCSKAQANDNEESLLTLRLETRLDYQRHWLDGTTVKENTGFEGKFINIRADGNITDNLSYSWRQRLNKEHSDRTFFDATDWVYLNYNIGQWSIAGGKQVVAIGGWEYDRAPIDLYGCSVFWNNIPCYEIGASAGYSFTESDKLTFQFCESPFYTSDNRDMYSYNLLWNGNHGWFNAIYSINMIEYLPGRFINYIALGNKFTVDKVTLELDLMNRASRRQTFLLKDISITGEISFRPTEKWNIFGKMTYDVNRSGSDADMCVLPGTEMKMIGGGLEFSPLKNRSHALRFHANLFYSWGKNANDADLMQNKTTIFDIGVKWNMNLLSFKR